jgi:hypothetical protein
MSGLNNNNHLIFRLLCGSSNNKATESCSGVGSTPASYLGDPGFNYWFGNLVVTKVFVVVFLSPST